MTTVVVERWKAVAIEMRRKGFSKIEAAQQARVSLAKLTQALGTDAAFKEAYDDAVANAAKPPQW